MKHTYYTHEEPILSFDKGAINQGLLKSGRYSGFDKLAVVSLSGSEYVLDISHNDTVSFIDDSAIIQNKIGVAISSQGLVHRTDEAIRVNVLYSDNNGYERWDLLVMDLTYVTVVGANNPTYSIKKGPNDGTKGTVTTPETQVALGYIRVKDTATASGSDLTYYPIRAQVPGDNTAVVKKYKDIDFSNNNPANLFEGILNTHRPVIKNNPSGTPGDASITNRPFISIKGSGMSNRIVLVDAAGAADHITDLVIQKTPREDNTVPNSTLLWGTEITIFNNTGNTIEFGFTDISDFANPGIEAGASIITFGSNPYKVKNYESITLVAQGLVVGAGIIAMYLAIKEEITITERLGLNSMYTTANYITNTDTAIENINALDLQMKAHYDSLSSDISDNASDIAVNLGNISANLADITTLTTWVNRFKSKYLATLTTSVEVVVNGLGTFTKSSVKINYSLVSTPLNKLGDSTQELILSFQMYFQDLNFTGNSSSGVCYIEKLQFTDDLFQILDNEDNLAYKFNFVDFAVGKAAGTNPNSIGVNVHGKFKDTAVLIDDRFFPAHAYRLSGGPNNIIEMVPTSNYIKSDATLNEYYNFQVNGNVRITKKV